jgi:hypothetical protein
MNKNVRKLAFVLLLFFIAGTLAVFAISAEDYDHYYKMGYNAGYNHASGSSSKNPPQEGSANMNAAYSRAGIGDRKKSEERGAFREGFLAGFYAQKNGD